MNKSMQLMTLSWENSKMSCSWLP